MPQQVADGRQVNARFQERHGSTVANAMWVQPLLAEIRRGTASRAETSGEDVTDAEPGQWLTAVVQKDTRFRPQVQVPPFAERFQHRGGLRPQRAVALLSSLGVRSQLQLIPPPPGKRSGSRIRTIRCSDESTSSSPTATAGAAIAFISTTTPAGCERSLPVGPT